MRCIHYSIFVSLALLPGLAGAQNPSPAAPSGPGQPSANVPPPPPSSGGSAAPVAAVPGEVPKGPHGAYGVGAYQNALEGFVDQQVERPQDPYVLYNIGSTQYQIGDYQAARTAFEQVLLRAPELRQRVTYNLGSLSYREGKLEEAVAHYQKALQLDGTDQDAKFNLEFVREEIKRRLEESKKRQEEEAKDGKKPGETQQQQPEKPPDEPDAGNQGEDSQDEGQQQPGADPDGQQAGPDSDADGLSDATEVSSENPTDPQNPDTDGDGLKDGLEDQNHNGKVDPGETDPNKSDSDGDGVSDGEDKRPLDSAAGQGPEGRSPGELDENAAERLLRALKDEKPMPSQSDRRGRRGRSGKDW